MSDPNKFIEQVRARSGLTAAGMACLKQDCGPVIAVAGSRERNGSSQVTPADLWHLGSVGKSMTATLTATLFHNRLDNCWLQGDITRHFPHAHELWQTCTFRHLLTHTSGLPANFGLSYLRKPYEESLRMSAVQAALSKPPARTPGSRYKYSNLGYTLLGLLCEFHSAENGVAQPFEALLQQHIGEQLGLASLGFGPPQGEHPCGHQVLLGFRKKMPQTNRHADNTPLITPAGRMHMTLADLAIFGMAHLQLAQGNTASPLGHLLPNALHAPNLSDYACGWVVGEQEWAGPIIWHNGSNRFWYCLLMLLPDRNAVLAFTTNDGAIFKAERAFFKAAEMLCQDDSLTFI